MPPIREKCESARVEQALMPFGCAQPVFLHGLAADEVPPDNLFKRFFGAGMIPNPVGPDHGDRPTGANLKAIGLGPLDPAARVAMRVIAERADQVQLGQPPFEELPRSFPLLA